MVWYLEHQVKGRTSGAQNPYGSTSRISHARSSWEVTKRLSQDTTTIVLPARCVHFTRTNIIVLGRSSNHHICLRFRSGWCQNNLDSSSLESKMKVCNTIDKMTLRYSRGMNYDSKLQNMSWFCYNMWTRCPGQAWPHSSPMIKHYRVLIGNHHWNNEVLCMSVWALQE